MDVSSPEAAVPSVEPSAKLFCCSSVRRRLSLASREELYHILRMTGPLVFGGENLLRVGVIWRRGILILSLFCLPCWDLLINTRPSLLTLSEA